MTTAPGTVADAVLEQALASTTQRVIVVNVATLRITDVSAPLVQEFGRDLRGQDARELLVGGPAAAVPLLATGQIEGYELTRQIRLPAGIEDAYVWVHALGEERPPRSAVIVIDLEDVAVPLPTAESVSPSMVIGTVDDEWRIDRLSADAGGVFGVAPGELHGVSVLTLLHPSDLAEFLTGLGHSQASGSGVALRVRVRGAPEPWRWMRMIVSPLGARPAFAFSFAPFDARRLDVESAVELEQRLARIAREVHSVRTAHRASGLPSLAEAPLLATLTAREWEIASMVRTGAGIDDVAKSLHLSASTVRNHLSTIYGKLGVRSLAQLLVALHAAEDSARSPERDEAARLPSQHA